jgi:hypothetical protein
MSELWVPIPPGPPFTRGGKERRPLGIEVWHTKCAHPGSTFARGRRQAFPYCDLTLAQATLIVVIAGLLWRTVRYALAFPLWGDEAYVAINLLTRDLTGLAQPLEYFQIAPPGFLWAEWLAVHTLGTSERALRLVPYLAGVAVYLGAIVTRERSIHLAAHWLTYGLLTALNWGIVFVAFAYPQASGADALSVLGEIWNNAFPPLKEPWRLPFWLLDIHTGNMLAYPYGGNNFGSTLTTIVVVAGCIRIWRHRVRRPLLFLLLSPLPVALLAAALHRYPYGTSTRVMLYMAPTFCLLIGEGIMGLLQLRQLARHGPLIVGGMLAAITVACMAANVISPYKAYDDILHRSAARWVAARTTPGDQWVVFNGASPPPLVKGLMVMPWLQRVAEARFYLMQYAPVPLRWEPDPETVVPGPGGKVWLLIQDHGDNAYFPHARLEGYQRALTDRLGPPRVTTIFRLPRDERWSICEYSSTCGAAR